MLRTLAEALQQTGELVRSAELCGCVLNWRGAPYDTRQETMTLLRELAASLPPEEQLAAALERGRLLGLEDVVAQALGAGSAAGSTPSFA